MRPDVILEIVSLSKAFGSVVVADDIDLAVEPGVALGIIGPNGAGKTSLFNLIVGALTPDKGTIRVDGRDVTKLSQQARARLGLVRSFQVPRPFAELSVFENLLVGASHIGDADEAEIIERCGTTLAVTGLLPLANRRAGALTLLERKRLELARAMATRPRVLLLDEIAGGLTEAECTELVGTIRDLRARGVTIIWIEHVVHALLAIVDRLMVLNFGRKIAEGPPREVFDSAEVREIYLGIEA